MSVLPTSLAHRAENAPATVTAPPERRTRERFDPSALKRDPLYVALIEHLPEPITTSEWQDWAAMIGQLHRAHVSAADIPTAVKGHHLLMPTARMTVRSIVKHWAAIREGKTREQLELALTRRSQEIRQATPDAERERERQAEQKREVERLLRDLGYADDAGNIARG